MRFWSIITSDDLSAKWFKTPARCLDFFGSVNFDTGQKYKNNSNMEREYILTSANIIKEHNYEE